MKGIKLGLFGISLGLVGLSFSTNNFITISLSALGALITLIGCVVKEK